MTATKAELAKSYSVHATTVRRDAAVTAGGWHTPQRYATIRAMPGRLDLRSLEALVRGGEIDTVLTVIPDGYGRLLGKRVVARHFLEHVARDGVNACIYLFTVDMEMEPLPGFKLTSWERGYGEGRVGQGPGGDQPRVRRGARDGRSHHALQARGEGDRPPAGLLADVHGQVRHGRGRVVVPPALVAVGSRWEEGALRRRRSRRAQDAADALRSVAGRSAHDGPRAGRLLRADRQLLQAIPGGLVRAHPDRRRLGQSHVRIPPLRRGERLPRGEPRSRRRRESVSRLRGHHRGRLARHPEPPQAAEALRGQRLRGRHAAPGPQDAARGHRRARAFEGGADRKSTR